MTAIHLKRADPGDLDVVAALWSRASMWLGSKGTDQWQYPVKVDNLTRTIKAGELWFGGRDGADDIATITVSGSANPAYWYNADIPGDALYVSRMVVDRPYAGEDIGTALLDWVGQLAMGAGRRWVRLDAWRTNSGLLRYYLERGFDLVRIVDTPDYPAACFQRPADLQLRRGPVIESDD